MSVRRTYRMGALLRVVIRSGCPLFDRPKRGRKKPHQPALAHCVRVAGLDALRLTALLRAGAANRKGPEGHPVDSLGHLRWPRSDIDSRKAPLRRRTVRGAAPRKARETNRRKKERRVGRRYGSRSVRCRKERRSREDFYPRTAGVFRSLFRWDGLCARELFTHPRPVHRSRPLPPGAWEVSRQEPLRFIRRAPCGDGASQPDRAVDGKTNAAL